MPQISKIGFDNFRVFDQPTEFDLSRINILTGTNGSGKSSVIKGLMLFFDSVRKTKNFEYLLFNEVDQVLGGFQNILAKNKEENKLNIKIYLDFSKRNEHAVTGWLDEREIAFGNDILIDLNYCQEGNNGRLMGLGIGDIQKQPEDYLLFYYNLAYSPEKEKATFLKLVLTDLFEILLENSIEGGKNIEIRNSMINSSFGANDVNFQKFNTLKSGIFNNDFNLSNLENQYSINELKNLALSEAFILYITNKYSTAEDVVIKYYPYENFQNALEEYFEFLINIQKVKDSGQTGTYHWTQQPLTRFLPEQDGTYEQIFKPELTEVFKLVKASINTILQSLKSFEFNYIPAFRGLPQRIYLFQDNNTIIHKFINDKWIQKLSFNKDQIKFINKWLKEFDIAESFEFEHIPNVGVIIYFINENRKINIVDMGFGVTQLFPLIIGIIMNSSTKSEFDSAPQLNFLLIEEPESNLHPALQSKLGDFFIDAINKFDVKLIIETHSEYLIRKLQYGVAKKKMKAKDINLYYFNNPQTEQSSEKKEIIRKINIQNNGFLDGEFGPGFFDVSDSLYLDLFALNNKKEVE